MRVLLAEDQPAARLGARLLLQEAGRAEVVGESEKAEEVVHRAKELRPDLVVLALELEDQTGALAACRELKSLPSPPRVLVYAAGNSEEDVAAAGLAGADSYLHKGPGCGGRLHEVARRTCDGHRDWLLGPAPEDPRAGLRAVIEGSGLTDREREVLALVIGRRTNEEISDELHLSLNTVKTHTKRIWGKLPFKNRRELLDGTGSPTEG